MKIKNKLSLPLVLAVLCLFVSNGVASENEERRYTSNVGITFKEDEPNASKLEEKKFPQTGQATGIGAVFFSGFLLTVISGYFLCRRGSKRGAKRE